MLRPEGNITAIIQQAVLSVTYKRQAVVGKLTADLMCAPGNKLYTHQTQPVLAVKATIIQLRLLHSFTGYVSDIAFAFGLVAVHKVFKAAFIGRAAMDHSQIALAEVPFPYLAGELRCRISAPGKHHKSADYPVKPVHRAYIGKLITQPEPHKLRQAPGLIRGQDTCRFYTNYYFVVNIFYLHSFQLLKTPRHSAGV